MSQPYPSPAKYDRREVGAPISVGRFRIEPVARVVGFTGGAAKASPGPAAMPEATDGISNGAGSVGRRTPDAPSGSGAAAGAFVRVTPVEVIVHDGEADETRVAITDVTAQAIRGMAMSALLIGLVGTVLVVLATVLGRRA